jgi:hypothetical protein
MRRQRCVIGAVIEQADPAKLALAFPQIAAAAKSNITTGIPLADLGAWVTLTQRVKGAQVRSLPFTSSVIDTVNPDFPTIHQLVLDALNPPSSASPSPTPGTGASRGGSTPSADSSPSSTAPGKLAPEEAKKAQNINAVC